MMIVSKLVSNKNGKAVVRYIIVAETLEDMFSQPEPEEAFDEDDYRPYGSRWRYDT
jgi:hypothetical protein